MVFCQQGLKKSLCFHMEVSVQEPVRTEHPLIFSHYLSPPPPHTLRDTFFGPLHLSFHHRSNWLILTFLHGFPSSLMGLWGTPVCRWKYRELRRVAFSFCHILLELFLAHKQHGKFPLATLVQGFRQVGKRISYWENFPWSAHDDSTCLLNDTLFLKLLFHL